MNEFINRIAKKQDLTYCYLLKVRNSFHKYENSFSLKLEERMALLNKIIDLSSKTDSTCSVVNDYLYTLTELGLTNLNIDNIMTFVIIAVAPFNIIKGIVVSLVTMLIYKHISPILKGNR